MTEATNPTDSDHPSSRYSWYVVSILTLTYTISFIDRQIMALMIEPIRQDLHISDTQVSLLIGLAFAIFYTLLGIPIGRLADRGNRRAIIAAGIMVWCVMTAACGLARNYLQLFLARIGVGVGEAALSPSALSMIGDYFPKDTRVRAIAVYNMGISLGTGLAMILGGRIIAHVMQAPPLHLPIVGELYPWQTAFLIVGLPGLLMAAAMITVREPPRRERLTPTSGAGAGTDLSLRAAASYLGARSRMYGSHFLGMSAVAILAYGLFAWVPTMFIRTWGWTIADIGLAYGAVILLAAPLSAWAASWLCKHLTARGHEDAQMRAALYFIIAAITAAIIMALAPSPWIAVVALLPASLGGTAATACGLSALVTATPNQVRAQACALYYLVVNVFGLTLGPTGIALFTDYVFGNEQALRYSIACVSALAGVPAIAFLSFNLQHYRRALAESRTWAGGHEPSLSTAGSSPCDADFERPLPRPNAP